MRQLRRFATRDVECELLQSYPTVLGVDEVGRGAIAGPVAVGVALVTEKSGPAPVGLADSKMLSARAREELVDPIHQWVAASAVGMASPAEIDEGRIIGALRLAASRAIEAVRGDGATIGVTLLDGVHNWLAADLLGVSPVGTDVSIMTRVHGDAECAVIAAASVLAKVERDRLMCSLEDPGYDWIHNKGYASRTHIDALSRMGACDQHRRSWKLPGVEPSTNLTNRA